MVVKKPVFRFLHINVELENLAEEQAYLALFLFLEVEYLLTSSDESGGLLSGM
jgi:hypothetical protein